MRELSQRNDEVYCIPNDQQPSVPSATTCTRSRPRRRRLSRGRRVPARAVASSPRPRAAARDEPAGVRRRDALALAVALPISAISTIASSPDASNAAYETSSSSSPGGGGDGGPSSSAASASELSVYRRSFRERFETSISSGTHDYSFKYPKESWKPDIVSLNDGKLYGVDLRFSSPTEGKLCTHVLPFVDKDSLKDVGSPEVALDRFVELIGAFWDENGFGVPGGAAGTVKSTKTVVKDGVTYYEYELTKPHNLISAAVTDGQLYVINASAGERAAVGERGGELARHRRVVLRPALTAGRDASVGGCADTLIATACVYY